MKFGEDDVAKMSLAMSKFFCDQKRKWLPVQALGRNFEVPIMLQVHQSWSKAQQNFDVATILTVNRYFWPNFRYNFSNICRDFTKRLRKEIWSIICIQSLMTLYSFSSWSNPHKVFISFMYCLNFCSKIMNKFRNC